MQIKYLKYTCEYRTTLLTNQNKTKQLNCWGEAWAWVYSRIFCFCAGWGLLYSTSHQLEVHLCNTCTIQSVLHTYQIWNNFYQRYMINFIEEEKSKYK